MPVLRKALLCQNGGLTRRQFASLLTLPLLQLDAQGVASRNVRPLPHGRPSGLPWNARFTDIARAAGLRSPCIYGTDEQKPYIVEAVGCGAAFFDYDNDGWIDIFLLSGRRLDGPA